jgi:hypothetical protein
VEVEVVNAMMEKGETMVASKLAVLLGSKVSYCVDSRAVLI